MKMADMEQRLQSELRAIQDQHKMLKVHSMHSLSSKNDSIDIAPKRNLK